MLVEHLELSSAELASSCRAILRDPSREGVFSSCNRFVRNESGLRFLFFFFFDTSHFVKGPRVKLTLHVSNHFQHFLNTTIFVKYDISEQLFLLLLCKQRQGLNCDSHENWVNCMQQAFVSFFWRWWRLQLFHSDKSSVKKDYYLFNCFKQWIPPLNPTFFSTNEH